MTRCYPIAATPQLRMLSLVYSISDKQVDAIAEICYMTWKKLPQIVFQSETVGLLHIPYRIIPHYTLKREGIMGY